MSYLCSQVLQMSSQQQGLHIIRIELRHLLQLLCVILLIGSVEQKIIQVPVHNIAWLLEVIFDG